MKCVECLDNPGLAAKATLKSGIEALHIYLVIHSDEKHTSPLSSVHNVLSAAITVSNDSIEKGNMQSSPTDMSLTERSTYFRVDLESYAESREG